MVEKDISMDLPPEIACIHRKWNVRSVAYRTLINNFQELQPSAEEWALYKNAIPNIAAETFPTIREQALETVLRFVHRCGAAPNVAAQVIHSLLETIPANTKTRSKHLLEQIMLEFVEIGCARDVIDELLKTALVNQGNVATISIELITKILSVFGPTAIDLAYVIETLPYLQESEEELEYRSATKALILEIYRWQGKDSIKNVGQILNPADMKEVTKKYEDVKQTTKLKPIRSVRDGKRVENSSKNSIPEQETDLLKQINEDFYKKLDSCEWNERRDALVELEKILEGASRLRPGNYEPLLVALKKVITEDQCVIVVGLAISSITGLAKGLREQFNPYATGICRILLEKFVEKRQNITEQLRKALDVLTTTTSFESLIRTINNCLGSKNPTIRFETIQLLSRMFKKTNRQTLRKSEFGVVYRSLVNCLHHRQVIIREKSFIALALAFKIAGEGVIMPYLENVDASIKMRIKNFNLDQDLEEKYNAIKYRNVAKKEFKKDGELKEKKENSSKQDLKESETLHKDKNELISPTREKFKIEAQKKKIKSTKKHQALLTFNKSMKRWNPSNSNVTIEKFYIDPESKNQINRTVLATSSKDCRRSETMKKYPYRKPYTVHRKEISNILSKERRKKKRIFSYKKKSTSEKSVKELDGSGDQAENDLAMNVEKLNSDQTKLQSQVSHNMDFLEQAYKKGTEKNPEVSHNNHFLEHANNKGMEQHSEVSHNNHFQEHGSYKKGIEQTAMHLTEAVISRNVPGSTKKPVQMEAMSPSACTQENSETSQPVQQSVQTLGSSKCGEGFIVLTENEVKKLLGLKRISALSDDSCSFIPDWTTKKNLFRRSYKIFQVSKGNTDRETQTSLTAFESCAEIGPENGVIDLTKTTEVIPTQTNGVSIEEKGTDAHRIKRYNRGTQWVQHWQTEILDTKRWLKRETSSERQTPEKHKSKQCQKVKDNPLKVQSLILKKIEYRRPSKKENVGKSIQTYQHPRRADHSSKRTMEINTFTVARSNPLISTINSKSMSATQTSELNTSAQEVSNVSHNVEAHQLLPEKEKNRENQVYYKTHDCEDVAPKHSKHVKKIKRKYTHEIVLRSNKPTIESRQNDISSQTLIRLKKIERTKHRSLNKAISSKRDYTTRPPHRSDVSIHSTHHKSRRSPFTKTSGLIHDTNNDTSSSSYQEGCNFLPFVAKNIIGRHNEHDEKQHSKDRKNQNRNKSHRNAKRAIKPSKIDADEKCEHAPIGRTSRKRHKRKPELKEKEVEKEPAKEMDPQTKQMVIDELLKACDISQATFEKMVRRKMSPARPGLFGPKAILQRVSDFSSTPDQASEDHSNHKDHHKTCTII